MIELSRNNPKIKIHAGVLPQRYAQLSVESGPESALKQAQVRQYLAKDETATGSEDYYSVFESLITGRNMHIEGS